MTAPGDPIQDTQGQDHFGIGHGADPDEIAGITRLETGRYEAGHEKAGQMLEGSGAHTDAMTPGTTAWRNTVILGTEAIPWSPPTQERGIDLVWGPTGPVPVYVEQRWPYQDPAHRHVATIDVP